MADEADRWRQFFAQHGAALVLFARQWSATRSEAEDAVQDGFVKYWKTRSQAKDVVAYLYTCVRGAAMDIGRGERRREVRESRAGNADEASFDFSPHLGERQKLIEAALGQLPGDQREVIVMKIWGGLTFAQIGTALGVPLNTAASRYRYGLARLEADLSEVARD